MGQKHANASCTLQKQESENAAIARTASANSAIGNIRVEAEREHSATRELFAQIEEALGDGDYLQEMLVANGCVLDPDRLRLLNRAILRESGTD